MMALQRACEYGYSTQVRFATLLHDLGKALTPFDEWPRHVQHEERGLSPVREICDRFKVPSSFRDLAEIVCREHLMCHRVLDLRPGTVWRLLQRIDVLRKPERVEEYIQACICDARGRLGLETRDYPQADYLRTAIIAVRKVRAADLPTNLKGMSIGEALVAARIEAITAIPVVQQVELDSPAPNPSQAYEEAVNQLVH